MVLTEIFNARSEFVSRMPDQTVIRHISTLFEVGVVGGLTDLQLLERFAARGGVGAEAAFAALVERHGPMVLRVCRAILRDDHAAEDAFQATFLVLARKAGSLWVRDSVGPWLHTVARRVAIHTREAADRRKAAEQRAAEMIGERRAKSDRDHEVAPILDEEISRLPDRYRKPVILCDLEGFSYEEAARHLGCAMGTLKSRLARAREQLRDRLIRRGVVPTSGYLGSVFVIKPAEVAVPVTLMKSTVLAAARYVATSAATGGMVPPLVVELTEGVLKSMRINMMIKIGGFALAAGLAMSGAGLLADLVPVEQPVHSQPDTPQADAAVPDQERLAEEQEKQAKAEENERKAKAEENERKLKAEEREQKAKAEENERKLKAEENERKAKAEENERKLKAEENERKLKAEEREQKAKAEENERKLKAEDRERKLKAEEKEKQAKGEEHERKLKAEEKQKQAKGEDRERKLKAEEKQKQAKGEDRERKLKAEEKQKQAKGEEHERKLKAEEKEKQAKAEERERKLKAEERERNAKEAEAKKKAETAAARK
jgi:RNA polymerase sigma factor (sigma-70 family)